MKARRIILAFVFVLITIATSRASFTIGGFDSSRGGALSLESGGDLSDLRTDLSTAFPGVTLSESPTLTTAYLDTINLLLIAAPSGDTTEITSLSSSEQSALVSFVESGHGVLIFCDNNDQFNAASQSMANPFGVDSTGFISGTVTATVTDGNHPVTDGPFGSVSTFTTAYPGWFDSLGTNAVSLAELPNDDPILAAINPGVLSPGSGGVVLFGDASMIGDATVEDGSNLTLINNAIAFADVPEPSTWAMMAVGAGLMMFGVGKRRLS